MVVPEIHWDQLLFHVHLQEIDDELHLGKTLIHVHFNMDELL